MIAKKSSKKMKCVVMWLNMCCFPVERHQIRVWAVKVSFDPRQFAHTVTYMDVSTSSCSLQYQLSFKARWCQLAEWAMNGWIQSAKRAHIWTFPQSAPFDNFVILPYYFCEHEGLRVEVH